MTATFLSAAELRERALDAIGRPRGGVTASIPVPMGREHLQAAIFLYVVAPNPRAHIVYPPHALVVLDPKSGVVVSNRAVTPKELGKDAEPGVALPRDPGERRIEDADLYWEHWERLHAIFTTAWEPFERGRVRLAPEERAVVVACAELFDELAEERVRPWYEAIGGPFLAWMRAVRERARKAPR